MRHTSRQRWGLIIGSGLALLAILAVGVVGYWQYVTSVPPFTAPPTVMPEPNGYTRALAALARLFPPRSAGPLGPPPGYGTTPAAATPPSSRGGAPVLPGWPLPPPHQLQVQMARRRPVLDGVRATLRLEWRSPPNRDGWTMSDNARFRACARCFSAECIVAHNQGRYELAMQRSLDAMELASRLPHGGGIIPWLVADACHGIGMSQAERLVWDLPADAIPGALARVRRIRRQWPSMQDMLEAERADSLQMWTQAFRSMKQEPLLKQLDGLRSVHDEQSLWETIRLAMTPRRLTLANQDRYFRQLIAESRKPVRQRVRVDLPHDAWSEAWGGVDPQGRPWTFERVRTHFALLEVALTVRAELFKHGRYPARLADVSRRWLPAVPRDTWDQPIAYRLKGGHPVVYSLGPDGKDDGGVVADPTTVTATTRGDLVLGHLSRRLRQR